MVGSSALNVYMYGGVVRLWVNGIVSAGWYGGTFEFIKRNKNLKQAITNPCGD